MRVRGFVVALSLGLSLVSSADVSLAREKKAPSARVARAHGARHGHASKRRAARGLLGDHRLREAPAEPRRPRAGVLPLLPGAIVCPEDMVAVAGRVCVDRFETSLVDRATLRAWPPYYAPSLDRARGVAELYAALREKAPEASLGATMPIPAPPAFAIDPKAVSVKDATPQGYLSADEAEGACRAAGKRLCTESEWLTACRGESETEFPYGEHYEEGACNVYRESHPSFLLHQNSARYHDDPRNNLVTFEGRPLLRRTGATPRCASRWGDDAVYDMVGNLDEWVSDERGVFVGGFYSRGTRSGCFSRVSNHPRAYSDYSTGARCCADPSAAR